MLAKFNPIIQDQKHALDITFNATLICCNNDLGFYFMALIDDYQKALNKIDRRYDTLENRALADLLFTTRQFTRDIASVVIDLDTSQSNAITQATINQMISRYQQQVTDRVRSLFGDVYELGLDSVIGPLAAIDEPTQRTSDDQSLATLLGSAAIIGAGIAGLIGQAVGTQIRLGTLGDFSPSKLMANIRKTIVAKFSSIRTTIRTETTRVFNMAHQLQLKSSNSVRRQNDKLLKGWLTRGDKRVRPTHRAAGRARPIPVNQPFLVGSDKLMFPGDPKGSPGETINCRCRMYTVHPKVMNAKVKQQAV